MEIWFAFRCAGGAGGIDSLPSPAQHHHRSDGFARLRVVLRGSEFPDPHGKNAGATGSDCFRIPAAGFLYSDPRRQSTYFRTHQQFGILLDFISDSRIISRAECDRHGPTPRHGPDVVAQIFGPYFTTKKSGHGPGLSRVQGITSFHNAALEQTRTRESVHNPVFQEDVGRIRYGSNSVTRNNSAKSCPIEHHPRRLHNGRSEWT